MPQVSRRLLGRRKVLVGVGVGAAAVVVGMAPARALADYGKRRRGREKLIVPAGERFELLGESIAAGTSLGRGTLVAVLPVHHGAVPVLLRTPAGEQVQVDVLRRDPAGPTGVAETARLSLFIANTGDGNTPTAEAQAHAARALAGWLAARDGAPAQRLATELLSFRERQRAHPEGVFSLWS
jgi:hypothetical protein